MNNVHRDAKYCINAEGMHENDCVVTCSRVTPYVDKLFEED